MTFTSINTIVISKVSKPTVETQLLIKEGNEQPSKVGRTLPQRFEARAYEVTVSLTEVRQALAPAEQV